MVQFYLRPFDRGTPIHLKSVALPTELPGLDFTTQPADQGELLSELDSVQKPNVPLNTRCSTSQREQSNDCDPKCQVTEPAGIPNGQKILHHKSAHKLNYACETDPSINIDEFIQIEDRQAVFGECCRVL